MLSAQDIRQKAERKYADVLRAWLVGDLSIFPLAFTLGKANDDLVARITELDILRSASDERTPNGYRLEWETVNTRKHGQQSVPRRAIFTDLSHYLAYLRKRTEFEAFTADVSLIRRQLPALDAWMSAHPLDVIAYHGVWVDLLSVCRYFLHHPHPNCYLRELPIEVHTKFIESHTAILRQLLDAVLPESAYNPQVTDFNARYGLKDKPNIVRLRLLDEQLDWKYGLALDDIALPLKQAAHLLSAHLQPRRVIIVENLINFLTLPPLTNAVGIWGGGFAVQQLQALEWLQQADVLYWGDMDAQGFQILARLRVIIPHTRSIMMDLATFNAYHAYVGTGTPLRDPDFTRLTTEERLLAEQLTHSNQRLEQEHISQAYANQQIQQHL